VIVTITGLPGNGKTLYALNWVKAKAEKEGRPVFYARIAELTLPCTQIDPFEWFKCPPGSIVVIDECQKSADPTDPSKPTLFGIRPRGAPVPEWVSSLETHRHLGVDLVLITQHPMLMDSHVRRLVGLHFHVVRKFGMPAATVHEWGSIKENCDKNRDESTRHDFKYPKASYGWYKSAEAHTHKVRLPFRVWLFLALPFVLVGLVWYLWQQLMPKDQAQQPQNARVSGGQVTGQAKPAGPMTAAEYTASFTPRVHGLAYTAPAYDEVTKPVQAPYPAACIASAKRCQCYTQQGTKLQTSEQICRDIAAGGFFVAWQEPARAASSAPAVVEPQVEREVVHAAGTLGTSRTGYRDPQPSRSERTQ
jgi:zona occludens toxin